MFPRPTDPTLCEAGPHVRGIAISGTHAIWRWEAFAEASSCDEDAITFHAVATADIADAAATSLADWGQLYCPFDANDTRYVSAVDASGSQLVYSTVHQGCPGGPITGDVTLVANGIQTTVPGSPAAARLSASRSRVAWVAASAANLDGLGEPVGLPAVAPQTAIQVFDTATDAVATSVMPRGTVRSIALSGTVLAALVRRPSGEKVMVRYRIPDGQHLGTTRVSPRTPPSIDMAGSMIVFTVGRHILAMNATSGQTRLVATGQHQPIDVSIAGRRIAWIENGRRSGKIIATTA
jgi:hypothetical protein